MPVKRGKYKPYGRGREEVLANRGANQPRSEQLRAAMLRTSVSGPSNYPTPPTSFPPVTPPISKPRKTNRSGGADNTNPGGGGNERGYNNPGRGRGRRGQ